MEFVTYILYSYSAKRYYIGLSSNIIQRIYWHNNANKGFTTRFRPWEVIHIEFHETKGQARDKEKYFKTGKGREWIKNHFAESKGFISA
ncbi:MAG TPA: GIY-YIG nuclease family protein [Bacteroidia bacterium]